MYSALFSDAERNYYLVFVTSLAFFVYSALFSGAEIEPWCAAGFALLNLPKGKSLGRSKHVTSSYAQALATHCVGFLLYPSSAELPYAK